MAAQEITVPLALLAGIVSFASPCFLPIVPVYVGYLAGGAAREGAATGPAVARSGARRGILAQACAFVAGFSVVFVSLWASLGVVGHALGDQRGWLRIAGGAVLVVMGLHVAGLVEIPLLSRSARPLRTGPLTGRPTLVRSALLGVAFGAGWSPCIGPILGGVIGLASVSATVGEGALLLAAYCLGLGVPFVLVALGADALHRRLRGLARHEATVSLTAGGLLVATGFLMITDLFGRLTGVLPTFGA